ncbi:hypothetical protein B9G54_06560 [Alloscardovia macacae]|uniref:Uncharacterized protein n=1 Tax=Alloscardovia macacae TaxID=1160091 RepID=A0A1Y2SSY3_9BIFI|nr:hypothetical protein [Alloscardovia macacae]OTA25921.1 hypothetical protein B9G54_06560 [Alloscardovia macacae]OTA28037.1 hypothetical protein B9T39_07560 [Alloscardovia macacae]
MADDEKKSTDGADARANGADALSDAQVNAAFADLEKQFSSDFEDSLSALDDNLTDPGAASDASDASDADSADSASADGFSDLSLDPHFDDELAGILGQKAKVALILAPFAQPQILAALARMADVEMSVFFIRTGCVGVLHDLDGQGPEDAVRALSEMMSDLPFLLSVNRADKVSLTRWENGAEVEQLTPPLIFVNMDDVVEDLMIGFITLGELSQAGYDVVEASSFETVEAAMSYLAGMMRANRNPFADDGFDSSDGEAV